MDEPEAYTPTMPAERVEMLRHWHEEAYQTARAEGAAGQTFTYLGRTLVVPHDVMPITGVSHLLGEAVLAEVRAGDRVLDMGTGSGVNAILAAATSTDVVAVDINPSALAAAEANAERNGVADRIDIRHSDVFRAVDGVFDLIIFDPPFRWFPPRDLFESASTDEGYRALTAFFREGRRFLAAGGRILVFFGSSGDLGYLHRLIDRAGLRRELLAHRELERSGISVEYVTYRLTAPAAHP